MAPRSAFFVPVTRLSAGVPSGYKPLLSTCCKQEPTNHAATQSTGLLVGGDVHRPWTGIRLAGQQLPNGYCCPNGPRVLSFLARHCSCIARRHRAAWLAVQESP